MKLLQMALVMTDESLKQGSDKGEEEERRAVYEKFGRQNPSDLAIHWLWKRGSNHLNGSYTSSQDD